MGKLWDFRWGMWWGCVVLGVVALGWGLAVRGEAKEDERVTLLVKCEKKVVAEVLARLSDSDVEIWDTRTMKALRSPNRKSDVPPAKATGLLDAQGAMLAMFEMVEATRGASGDTTLELESSDSRFPRRS